MSEEIRQDGGEGEKSPMDQANRGSPVNGVIPPIEHRFPPGKSGNPDGRPTAGASLKEWLNVFADQGLNEQQLRSIARDVAVPWPKRAAANRAIKTMESPDLADFAGLLRGENQLEDLRAMGVNTDVVKKFKQKTRRVPTGNGETEEVIERDIELHDRSGDDFDRVTNHTHGTPKQHIEVDANTNVTSDGNLRPDWIKARDPEAK